MKCYGLEVHFLMVDMRDNVNMSFEVIFNFTSLLC